MNDKINKEDLQKKIRSTIIQDHKYCLDKCFEIIKTKDKQLKRKDITIFLLILLLGGAFIIHEIGYYKTPPIKNNLHLSESNNNNIGFNEEGVE